MLRTCDRCGIGDDYYMMYFGTNKSNVVNVICDECAQNHRDEYENIVSVHTMAKLLSDRVGKEMKKDEKV